MKSCCWMCAKKEAFLRAWLVSLEEKVVQHLNRALAFISISFHISARKYSLTESVAAFLRTISQPLRCAYQPKFHARAQWGVAGRHFGRIPPSQNSTTVQRTFCLSPRRDIIYEPMQKGGTLINYTRWHADADCTFIYMCLFLIGARLQVARLGGFFTSFSRLMPCQKWRWYNTQRL
jgi:hypothetical protein